MKAMELIWDNAPVRAKEVALLAAERIGWNKNTTYTVLKKLEAKGYIRRSEPGFLCTPLISREDVRKWETRSLLDRFFGGSKKALFSAVLEEEALTEQELAELRTLLEEK